MRSQLWKGRKVLLTGHTGFKGSWLSLVLQNLGAEVVGYSLPAPTQPSLYEAAQVGRGMTAIEGDVRDLSRLQAIFAEQRPEIVIHMAAQALVRHSYDNPVETYTTNVVGTLNVMEAVRYAPSVRVALVVTSDKCYENKDLGRPCRENDRLGGKDPYSSSKACAELVCEAYRQSFFPDRDYSRHGVAVASVRAGNVIGGGDWGKDRLVPDLIKNIVDGKPALIRRPNAIRPWQHVLEPLHGYLHLAEQLWSSGPKFSGGWNFGPDDEDGRPVRWVADRVTELWSDGARWQADSAERPPETHCLKLDCSKARALLGWSPRLGLATGLEWAVEWYREYYSNGDMRSLTEVQIVRFQKWTDKTPVGAVRSIIGREVDSTVHVSGPKR